MEIDLRMPRIAVPGTAITAEFVAVQPGMEVRPGDRLLDLRIGAWTAGFYSEVSGTVRDVRVFPGDEIVQDRVVMFLESPAPPPIRAAHGAVRPRPGTAAEGEIAFQLPDGLLRTHPPVLVKTMAEAGAPVHRGQALLEFGLGPIRMVWPSPAAGVVEQWLAAAGDELPEGTRLVRMAGAAPGPATVAPSEPAAAAEFPELTLPEFRRRAEALSGRVARLASLVRGSGLPNTAGLLDAECARLSGCRFTVAVVGEFKRGKSTFLNALAGREFLPHDVVPCTAFACRFQYAERLELVWVRSDGSEAASSAGSFEQIAAELDRVTRDSQASVREAIIRLPLELCREGVDLLDTPGLNDSEAMNQVTLSVLPNVDAAVLLLIPESPVSETERRFLADHLLARDIGRVLFVLNAADRLPAARRARVVTYIEGQIARILADRGVVNSAPSLLPVSSKTELLQPGSEESGFGPLRMELDRLLFRQRGRLTLWMALQRIRGAAGEAMAVLELRAARQAVSRESFQAFLQELERQLGATRLHSLSLRRSLLDAQARAESSAAVRASSLHLALLSLRESLPRDLPEDALQKAADEIRAELSSIFAQQAGRMYHQALNALFDDVNEIYRPLGRAVRDFVEEAQSAFVSQIAGQYAGLGTGALAARSPTPARLETPDAIRVSGPLGVRIDLSLGAMSWLFLADSVKSLLSGGELASSIQSRALEKLRTHYAQEIERQVRAKAGEAILEARLAEFARAPFHDLLRQLDQDLKIVLDDSFATLASLRQTEPAAGEDWQDLREKIAATAAECEKIAVGEV